MMLGGNGSPLHLGGVRCLPLVGGTMAQGASIKWDGRGGLSFSGDGILDIDNAAGSAGARIDGNSGKMYLNKGFASTFIYQATANQFDIYTSGAKSLSVLNSGMFIQKRLYMVRHGSTLLAGESIDSTDGCAIVVEGNGGAVTLTSTPNVTNGSYGAVTFIIGKSDTNTVTLQDEGTLANSGLRLAGGANVTLGLRDVIGLAWDDDSSKWFELFRSNNT